MNLRPKFNTLQFSDTGKVREHNEDAVGTNRDIALLVLADGMGGYNAGEVASGIAVRTVLELVPSACERETRNATDPETGLMRQSIILRDAIARANKVIHQTAKMQPQCQGMGTTIVACLFYDNRVSIAHVGDSRLYRFRRNRFEQLTMDHSLLQELVDRGFYSQEEAARSTNRNYVTRALGVEPTVQVELQEAEVQPEDIWRSERNDKTVAGDTEQTGTGWSSWASKVRFSQGSVKVSLNRSVGQLAGHGAQQQGSD